VPPFQELRTALPLSRLDTSWFSYSELALTAPKIVEQLLPQRNRPQRDLCARSTIVQWIDRTTGDVTGGISSAPVPPTPMSGDGTR
jgi:hypothetical protein